MATRTHRLDTAGRILDSLEGPPSEYPLTLEQWKAGAERVRMYLRDAVERGEWPDMDSAADAMAAGLIAAGVDPDAARACAEAKRNRPPTAAMASILEAEAHRAASSHPPAPAGLTGH